MCIFRWGLKRAPPRYTSVEKYAGTDRVKKIEKKQNFLDFHQMLQAPSNIQTLNFSNILKKWSKMALLGAEKYEKKQSHEFWCL